MEDLLKKAEANYPAGTSVKSLGTGLIAISGGIAFFNYLNQVCIRQLGKDSNHNAIRVFDGSKWALIMP